MKICESACCVTCSISFKPWKAAISEFQAWQEKVWNLRPCLQIAVWLHDHWYWFISLCRVHFQLRSMISGGWCGRTTLQRSSWSPTWWRKEGLVSLLIFNLFIQTINWCNPSKFCVTVSWFTSAGLYTSICEVTRCLNFTFALLIFKCLWCLRLISSRKKSTATNFSRFYRVQWAG